MAKKPKWKNLQCNVVCTLGPTETRTRIAGFRVQSANHYTIGPNLLKIQNFLPISYEMKFNSTYYERVIKYNFVTVVPFKTRFTIY